MIFLEIIFVTRWITLKLFATKTHPATKTRPD